MTTAVDRLLAEPAIRGALGEAAVRHSLMFTWSRTTQAWESLLAHRAAGLGTESGTDPVDGAVSRRS